MKVLSSQGLFFLSLTSLQCWYLREMGNVNGTVDVTCSYRLGTISSVLPLNIMLAFGCRYDEELFTILALLRAFMVRNGGKILSNAF